ncbi:heme oxygenase [Gloeopeniophorella convolvens]|nr:heme oxygenase [Gloeopeniophorella convolvens]
MADFENLDFSLPFGTLVRQATAHNHEETATHQGARWLTRGELDKEEYARFLLMLWQCALTLSGHPHDSTLEAGLEKHASHPVLSPTYNPTLLARAPALLADVSSLLDTPLPGLPSHPMYIEMTESPPAPLIAWTSRIRELSDSSDPSPLLAHAYVRYLGDLSGGQSIRYNVVTGYDLKEDDGAGVSFFAFQKLGGGGNATLGDMKKIKEWYRDGMNAGVGDDRARKELLLTEANKAYQFNYGLFTLLKAPTKPRKTAPMVAPIISNGQWPSEKTLKAHAELLQRTESLKPTEKMISVGSVLPFILALSLAHLILVLGGFTGEHGWNKLEAVWKALGGTFA